jgi:hypothetical protein
VTSTRLGIGRELQFFLGLLGAVYRSLVHVEQQLEPLIV